MSSSLSGRFQSVRCPDAARDLPGSSQPNLCLRPLPLAGEVEDENAVQPARCVRDKACRNRSMIWMLLIRLKCAPVNEVEDEAVFETSLDMFGAFTSPGRHCKNSWDSDLHGDHIIEDRCDSRLGNFASETDKNDVANHARTAVTSELTR